MSSLRTFLQYLWGPKYEKLYKHVFVLVVLTFLLTGNRQEIIVDQTVIIATSLFFSFSLVWRLLHSQKMLSFYRSMLALPLNSKKLLSAYFLAVLFDTFCTKASYLILAYLLLTKATILSIVQVISLICLGVILPFIMTILSGKMYLLAIGFTIFSLFILSEISVQISIPVIWFIVFALVMISFRISPLKLYKSNKNIGYERKVTFGRLLPYLYFLRYMMAKTNLLNLLILWGFSIFFAYMIVEAGMEKFLAIGLVLLCANTPLGTVLSSNPQNFKKLKVLPGVKRNFFLPYSFFVALILLVGMTFYIGAIFVLVRKVNLFLLLQACFVTLQSTLFIVFLELKYPLLNWRAITDLWQHPRKYIVPGVMLLMVMLTIVFPKIIYVFLLLLSFQFAFFFRKEYKYVI